MKYLHLNVPVRHYTGISYDLNQTLGGPLLAACAIQAGHQAMYYDAEALGLDHQRTLAEIDRLQPDVLGMTALTLSLHGVEEIARAVKERWPEMYVVVGGPYAVADPAGTLDATGADCAVIGEAELAIDRIIRERPTGILPVQAPADLDALPRPAWEYSHPTIPHYIGNEPRFGRPEACTLIMRGCPHACSFCSLPLHQNASIKAVDEPDRLQPLLRRSTIRYQSAEKIIEEWRWLRDSYDVRHTFVYADELVGAYATQRDWLVPTMEAIARANLGITWKTQGRCNRRFIEQDVMDAMSAAGCRAVMWGIESGSPKVNQAVHKGTHPADVLHTFRCAKRAGIRNWGYFMTGMPEETEADAAQTEALILALCDEGLLDYRQVTICTPEVNTPLWARAEREGWLPKRDPRNRWHYTPSDTPWMSADRIRYWRDRLATVGLEVQHRLGMHNVAYAQYAPGVPA